MIEQERIIFSPDMKMADLLEMNYRLLTVLSRLGFNMGFGEMTVSELCAKQDVDVNTFLLICNMYSYSDYMPTNDVLKSSMADVVVRYLHNSHSFYLDQGFRELENLIDELVMPCSAGQKKIILSFMSEYRKEVENHFLYEETVVFPYVQSIVSGEKAEGYSISQFEENHSNIEEKLSDLKNIVMKYLPQTCNANLATLVLYKLFSLAEDIEKHSDVENYVLIPMINRMEEHKNK